MNPVAWRLWSALAAAAALAATLTAAGCSSGQDSIACSPTACGNGGTVNVCTKSQPGGACVAVAYEVGSQIFICSSCSDCTQAASQAAQACAALPPGDGGGGSSSGGSSGSSSGGNGQTCAAETACGTSGVTYQECTTLASNGSCESIVYKTSNGHTFACSGCSCSSAEQQLSEYCANPVSDPVTTCSSAVSCGSDLTYQQCTTTNDGACQSMVYQVSNGATYQCASCSDCSEAVSQLDSYCASQGNPTTTCGSSVSCGSEGETYSECTTSSASGVCQSIAYEVSSGTTYTCASCTDCSAAYESLTNYCAEETTPTTTCGTASACGTGGATYSSCETDLGSTCQSISYETSTGEVYDCASCSDCTTALDDVIAYCDTLTSTVTCNPTCGSAATCCNCSGTGECITLPAGETCASPGCQ
jgi:hypothetical protein